MQQLLTAFVAGCAVLLSAPAGAQATISNAQLPLVIKTSLTAGKKYTFLFALYDAAVDGTLLWQESKVYRLPTSRAITHYLGSVEPFSAGYGGAGPVDFGKQLYVDVKAGSFHKRTKLVVRPYALWSEVGGGLDHAATAADLQGGAVTTAALAAGAVTTEKIAAGAVGTAQLGVGAVASANLASGAVGTAQLAGGAVTGLKIANNAVTASKIKDGSLTLAHINLPPDRPVTRYARQSNSTDVNTFVMGQWGLCFLSEFSKVEGNPNGTFHWCKVTYEAGTGWVLSARGGSVAVECAALCLP